MGHLATSVGELKTCTVDISIWSHAACARAIDGVSRIVANAARATRHTARVRARFVLSIKVFLWPAAKAKCDFVELEETRSQAARRASAQAGPSRYYLIVRRGPFGASSTVSCTCE